MQLYTVFHLNLAFSSIDVASHGDVVQRCYRPLLQLAEAGFPIGIEATAYTLECINKVDANWLADFRRLLSNGNCELVASGDSQIIGPLVPAQVNRQNLRLGQQSYLAMTGVAPKIAYLNEQAVSESLLDIYLDEGFEAVVVEWDNPFSHNRQWTQELLQKPASLATASGRSIKVLWNHAIGFQKFQRYVHGELVLEDYLQYLQKIRAAGIQVFPVYGSDAEVFDYRPGRYGTEAPQISGEWQRIHQLFEQVEQQHGSWVKPTDALACWQPMPALHFASAAHPVSVKKQAKYNITRWGLSGRNDLLLNTYCYQRYAALTQGPANNDGWRALCRLWASDLRTHLTSTRYQSLPLSPPAPPTLNWLPYEPRADQQIHYDEQRRRLWIKTPEVELKLNANRGLAVDYLAFASQGFQPVAGTLSHGFFDHISYGADFYTDHFVMERFSHRDRVTDLERVSYELYQQDEALIIATRLTLKTGAVLKYFRIEGENLQFNTCFERNERPEASIRLGFITLLNCQQRCWYSTALGGTQREFFQADSDFDHGTPVSSIVSSNCALGATSGEVLFGTGNQGLRLRWDPAKCAMLPMVSSKQINNTYLNRLWFSLAEADETLKAAGHLLNFSLELTPCSLLEAQS